MAVKCTINDIMSSNIIENNLIPYGNKLILFGGDKNFTSGQKWNSIIDCKRVFKIRSFMEAC